MKTFCKLHTQKHTPFMLVVILQSQKSLNAFLHSFVILQHENEVVSHFVIGCSFMWVSMAVFMLWTTDRGQITVPGYGKPHLLFIKEIKPTLTTVCFKAVQFISAVLHCQH